MVIHEPTREIEISVDEKTPIQAREQINPSIPMKPGCPKRQDPTKTWVYLPELYLSIRARSMEYRET
jgi:hypothetical protein